MKRLPLIFILFISALVFHSCSKDDSDSQYLFSKDNLLGKYSLVSLKMTEVITERVQNFEVTTTTVSTGDTFDVRYTFDDNNIVTSNGTYRIMEKKTQNSQTRDSAYIVVLNEVTANYAARTSPDELEIGGMNYKVRDFSSRGFKLNHNESSEFDGVRKELTINAEFKR